METDIVALANAHIDSYASASEQGRDGTISVDDLADKYYPHYLPSWTAYSLGSAHPTTSREGTRQLFLRTLALYRNRGLGTNIKKAKSRVVVISATSALCFITWRMIIPAEQENEAAAEAIEDALEFEDVYGFRAAENGSMKGGWEFVVADQEVLATCKRVPDLHG